MVPPDARSCRQGSGRDDLLQLIDGVVLSIDGQKRWGLREIDRIHLGLNLRRDRRGLAAGVGRGRRHRVGAVRPQGAVIAVAVPDEILGAGIDSKRAGIGGLTGRVLDGDRRGRRLVDAEASRGTAIVELRGRAVDHHGGADEGER